MNELTLWKVYEAFFFLKMRHVSGQFLDLVIFLK